MVNDGANPWFARAMPRLRCHAMIRVRSLAPLLLAVLLPMSLMGGEALTIALPPQSDLARLADLTAEFAGVSLQYNPQKVQGTVRLAVRGQVTAPELWAVFNQVLAGQGFTTVLIGLPPVYQIVPVAEAAGLSVALDATDLAKVPYPPGFAVVVFPLRHLNAESAVKTLSALSGSQISQARTLGGEQRSIVVAAPRAVLRQTEAILALVDRPGVVPAVRLVRPERAGAQALQASTVAAWTALGRVGAPARPVEVQVAPDGTQVLLIAAAEDIDGLEMLLKQLDRSEPLDTRSYRPQHFGIDEVGGLLQQLLRPAAPGTAGLEIIRDQLTGSLIIKATAEQHRRIAEVLRTLDDAPPSARRQVRTLVVRHRQADELAKVLGSLIATGAVRADATHTALPGQPTPPAQVPPPGAPGAPTAGPAVAGAPVTAAPAATTTAPTTTTAATAGDSPVLLTADTVTNTLIAIGDPRALDQVEALMKQLDQRQPQVGIEIVLVTISDSQSVSLGVELQHLIRSGSVTATVGSLFGLSNPVAGDPVARVPLASATGLGGVVLNPGDFAGVLQALETVADGRQIVRSKVVVNNNAKATVNGVVQEPLTSATSNGVAGTTTSVAGTTDAGTQITITPQISTADYVSLTYAITQSAFLGKSRELGQSLVPPTKRSDSVSSVATVPDGFIIALGGLSNRGEDHTESRIPFLGGIPLFGNLFKNQTTSSSNSRFYVFIRASVMRHASFADLKRVGAQDAAAAAVDTGEPVPEPQFIR